MWAISCPSPVKSTPHPLPLISPIPPEYADTLHLILAGLEAGTLASWKLGLVSTGYLALVLFAGECLSNGHHSMVILS